MRAIAGMFLAVAILTMSGCVTQLPKANVPHGSTLVLVNAVEPTLSNTHLGLTIFGNYGESLENDWNIPEFAESAAKSRLSAAGYNVVAVKPDASKIESLRSGGYFAVSWSDPKFKPEYQDWFKHQLSEHNASAIILLRTFKRTFHPNTDTTYGGYGVMSSMGAKPDEAFLYALVGATVFSGDPLTVNGSASYRESDCRASFSTAALPVENLKDLKAEQIASYRADMEVLVAQRIDQDLAASGLVAGSVVPCELRKL